VHRIVKMKERHYILTNFLCCHSFLATALKDYCRTKTVFLTFFEKPYKRNGQCVGRVYLFIFVFHFRNY
jgi:hypothetical protein